MFFLDDYEEEIEETCPECDEPLDEDGYCPNGCLDDDDLDEEEEQYFDDLEDVDKDLLLYLDEEVEEEPNYCR